jgi:hypothetical protein
MIELQLADVYTKFKRVSVRQHAGCVMLKGAQGFLSISKNIDIDFVGVSRLAFDDRLSFTNTSANHW